MHLSAGASARIREYVRRSCGLALGDDKAYLVRQRLTPVARAAGCADFETFADRLDAFDGGPLRDPVIDAITTQETSFFRDGHPFEVFRTDLLPRMVAARPGGRLRVWCAGCSTGQEAYTLAIIMLDTAVAEFTVVATDVSAKALAAAAAGVYARRETKGLSSEFMKRYGDKLGENWSVGVRLRRAVEFLRVNLAQPLPADLGTFDSIFCRNVMIYFDDDTRARLRGQIHERLNPGGFLVIGAAESLYGWPHPFETLRFGETIVYRKR
jgi:chemotaxis protein methyltransferase CheR